MLSTLRSSVAWPPSAAAVLATAPLIVGTLAAPLILESILIREPQPDDAQQKFLVREAKKRTDELKLILLLELGRHEDHAEMIRSILPQISAVPVAAKKEDEEKATETMTGDDDDDDDLDDSMVGQAGQLNRMARSLFQLEPKDIEAVSNMHAARLLALLLREKELRIVHRLTVKGTEEKYRDGEELESMAESTEAWLEYGTTDVKISRYTGGAIIDLAAVSAAVKDAKIGLLKMWREANVQVQLRQRARYGKLLKLFFFAPSALPWIAVNSVLTSAVAAMSGLSYWFGSRAIEALVEAARGGATKSRTRARVAKSLLAMIAMRGIVILLEMYQTVVEENGKGKFALKLKCKLFVTIFSQDLSYWDTKAEDPWSMYRLIRGVDTVAGTLFSVPATVSRLATTVISSIVMLRKMNGTLGYAVFASLVAQWGMTNILSWITKKMYEVMPATQWIRDTGGSMWWNLLKPKMFRTLRSFGREQEEAETFERQQKQIKAYYSEFGLTKLLNRLMQLLHGANGIMPQVLQYGFGAKLVMSGDLSAGDLTSAINEGTGVFASMQSVYSTWKDVIELLPRCETMVDLLERTPRIGLLPPHAAPMPVAGSAEDLACGGEIEFCDVKFAYPTAKKTKIFNGLSFTIQRGQCIGLMGEAGCGKSTIYNLLLRFYDPSSGHIQLDGKPLVSYNPMWLRRQCGHVGQEPVLFGKTLREEVLYGLGTDPGQQRLDRLAADGQPLSFIHKVQKDGTPKFPLGWLTRCDHFSGGEKQRVAIARAMVLEPSILLLDEATSALDEENQTAIMNAIEVLTHPALSWTAGSEEMKMFLIKSGFIHMQRKLADVSGHDLDAALAQRNSNGNDGTVFGLSAANCDLLADALRRTNRTTLVIAHRLSTLQKCDAIMCLKDGKVEEFGTHAELLANPEGQYSKYVEHQHSGESAVIVDSAAAAAATTAASGSDDTTGDTTSKAPRSPLVLTPRTGVPVLRAQSAPDQRFTIDAPPPTLLRTWTATHREESDDIVAIASLRARLLAVQEEIGEGASDTDDDSSPTKSLLAILDDMKDDARRLTLRMDGLSRIGLWHRGHRVGTDAFSGPPPQLTRSRTTTVRRTRSPSELEDDPQAAGSVSVESGLALPGADLLRDRPRMLSRAKSTVF